MSSFVSGSATVAKTTPPSTQLFVRLNNPTYPAERLPPPQILREIFEQHGTIENLVSAKAGTIAFITFATRQEAIAAKNAINGRETITHSMERDFVRTLFVDFARGKPNIQRQKDWREAQGASANSAMDFKQALHSSSSSAHPPRQVSAPVQPPVSAPVQPPVSAPVRPPASAPVQPPVSAPVRPPVSAPVRPPVSAPVRPPVSAPVQPPVSALPIFDPSILDDCNDSMFDNSDPTWMKWLGPDTCMALLNIGRNPQPKVQYQNMSILQLFSDGSPLVWYIPHPKHRSALTECLEGLDTGRFRHMTSVQIPSEVLKMHKCWRC